MMDTALTVLVVAGLSLAPLLLVVLSCYAKIAIVLVIARNAIGAPGVPPNLVIAGLAALLTAFVMAPVASSIASETRPHLTPLLERSEPGVDTSGAALDTGAALARSFAAAAGPIRRFLQAHARAADRRVFAELATALRGSVGDTSAPVADDSLLVLAPAFATSELRAAFLIGVAVLLPFLLIDLIVANVLAALGLPGLSAATVAVPLKLLLFVAIEGWSLLVRGLIAGYV